MTTNYLSVQLSDGATERRDHKAVAIGSDMFVFGGQTGSSYLSDLWQYDFGNNIWSQLIDGATERTRHTAVAIGLDILIFGGFDGTWLGDLWRYSTENSTWSQLSDGATSREYAAAVAIGSDMFMFGGINSNATLGDLWQYDLANNTWSQLSDGATPRSQHTAVAIGSKIIIFGGLVNGTFSGDLWQYDTGSTSWSQLSDGPPPRRSHSAIAIDSDMYILGGQNNTGTLQDLWQYNLPSNTWRQLSDATDQRQRHTAVAMDTRMLVFGGGPSNNVALQDLWLFYPVSDAESSDCIPPSVNAGSDQTVCAGTLVTLGSGSAEPNVIYQWSTQAGIISPNQFPTAAFVCSDTTYTVVASRTNVSDCFASDSTTLTISDCGCGCQQANTIFSQTCKNCPTVSVSIRHKNVSDILSEFFSSDGQKINIKDNCFISSYTPVKKNIGVNKSYGSDLGFGYVCYTYTNGLTVVRQENGDIILVNNGDINIDSPIDLTNAFHFEDWIGLSDSVSSDKKQPDLILMSNKGSININQDVIVPGLVTCMAPSGHVHVASGKTLQSSNNRVVVMASDSNHGTGSITAAISDTLTSGTPSGNTLTISDLTQIPLDGTTRRLMTSDNINITTNLVLNDHNLEIKTPGTVTTQHITGSGKNISIIAGQIHTSDIDTSNNATSANADGGNITLINQNAIACGKLSANGGGSGAAAGNDGMADGDGGAITLIAGTSITTTSIAANGGSNSGAGEPGGSCDSAGDGGASGPDGDGGTITIIAGISITTPSIAANGGSNSGDGGPGGSSGYGGDGGASGPDGDGGTITLIAGTSITTADISANGGGKGVGVNGKNGDEGGSGTDGDGGTITLVACGDITIASASVAAGPGTGSVNGKILVKSYGAISSIFSGSDVQILKMRDLRITLDANPKILPSHSDLTLTITIFNNGFGIEPSDNIIIDAKNTIGSFAPLPLPPRVSFPTLLPGQSNQFTLLLPDVHAGKFQYSVDVSDRCVHAQTATVGITGSDTALKVTLDLSDSHLLFDLFLPQDFIDSFGVPNTHQELCSDLHAYVQGSSKPGAFAPQIVEDFGPENAKVKALAARQTRKKESIPISYEKGSVVIKRDGADGFELIISDCTSDTMFIQYRDDLVPLFTKEMKVIGYEAHIVSIVLEDSSLGIVNVLPSDQLIKFSDTATFQVIVQNTGPVDVSDAFIKITSTLGETFSDKLLSFLPSDGTLVSDTITITPSVLGHHIFSFEINSNIVMNTNTTNNILSDIHLDICQLNLAMTTLGPIIALPNLPFAVPFDLTKTGGNPTAHIMAKISDVIYYQSDFEAGSHTIIIDAPGAFVDNTTVQLEAADEACYDEDFHVIQIIDSLSDAADLLNTSISDIKNIIDTNQIVFDIQAFLGRSDLVPSGFPADLRGRIWDTPVFKEILPLLLDRPGGLFDVGSLIQLFLFGSFVNMTVIPNPTLMLYLVLNLAPLPTPDVATILQTICTGLNTHSDIPNTATIHVSNHSDFFTPGALILNGSPSVHLSCSDAIFFFTAADGSFTVSMRPFNSDPYLLCYSDNTQQICKTFSDKTGSFDVVLVSDNTVVPPASSPLPKSHLDTLFKALLFAVVGGGTILIALKNKD